MTKACQLSPWINGQVIYERLLTALEDKESTVRSAAVSALGKIDPAVPTEHYPKLIPGLLGALKEEDSDVSRAAAVALDKIFPVMPLEHCPMLIVGLLGALEDDTRSAGNAAIVLSQIAPAVPSEYWPTLKLITDLLDEDSRGRFVAEKFDWLSLSVLLTFLARQSIFSKQFQAYLVKRFFQSQALIFFNPAQEQELCLYTKEEGWQKVTLKYPQTLIVMINQYKQERGLPVLAAELLMPPKLLSVSSDSNTLFGSEKKRTATNNKSKETKPIQEKSHHSKCCIS